MRVVYIDIDTLRPDHLGAYEYEQPTSPNIDRLADDGVVFDNAYVSNSPCMASRAAWISGRYSVNNGVATHGPAGRTLSSPYHWEGFEGDLREYWTLPELFFNERFDTAAVSSFPRHTAPWFYHLWHEYHHPQEPAGQEADWPLGRGFQTPRAEEVTDLGLSVLEGLGEDFFLYLQYWEPHIPYFRSDEEIERFRDPPLPPYPTKDQIESEDHYVEGTGTDITSMEEYEEMLAHYDAEIHYADRHVGRVIDRLRETGIYDETMVVVTADHGEEFGEHAGYQTHWTAHEGTNKVPLIVKPPASTSAEPGRRSELVTNVDVAPTLADYAGLEPPAAWQGRSLRPLLAGENVSWRDRIVYEHGLFVAQRAIRTDRWKLLRTYHSGIWDDRFTDVALYDLEADPWEQTNVADDHPELVTKLRGRMTEWVEDHVGRDGDPLMAVARDGPMGYKVAANDWNSYKYL
jgi:arylsulfatase A-like enzyme